MAFVPGHQVLQRAMHVLIACSASLTNHWSCTVSLLKLPAMFFATIVDVLAAFGVTYSGPYLLELLGNSIGLVHGSISACALVFIVFFVPETSVSFFIQIPR